MQESLTNVDKHARDAATEVVVHGRAREGVTVRDEHPASGCGAGIGRELFMSEATVKAHVSRVLVKLDATNRVQVAILAHDAGLLDQ